MKTFVVSQRDSRLQHAKPSLFSHILHVQMSIGLYGMICQQLSTSMRQYQSKKAAKKILSSLD